MSVACAAHSAAPQRTHVFLAPFTTPPHFGSVPLLQAEPVIDWRIVIAPPLVITNQLPIPGSLLVWEKQQVGAPGLTQLTVPALLVYS